MPDADDYTRCAGCDCSLCLIDSFGFDTCLDCASSICWDCQIDFGMRKKSATYEEMRKTNRDYSIPDDFFEPYKLIHDDTYDKEILELFDQYGEPGLVGGCPLCNKISDAEVLEYLIKESGMTRKEIEQAISNKE
jgi:hypothetical protein